MPAYSDARIVEHTFQGVNNSLHSLEVEGLFRSARLDDVQRRLHQLSVEKATLQKDFDHFIKEHFLPLQASIFNRLPDTICACHQVAVNERSLAARTLRRTPSLRPPLNDAPHSSLNVRVFYGLGSSNRVDVPTQSPSSAGHGGATSPISPVPSLLSITSSSDDEEWEDAQESSPALYSLVEGEEGTDEPFGSASSFGSVVWERHGAAGVREDSV